MKLTIFGTGYVGLVQAAVMAEVGHDVLCMDIDQAKIDQLQQGQVGIYEPGLAELVREGVAAGHLRFTHDVAEAVQHGAVQFIAVGTPPGPDGGADLSGVFAVAEGIARHRSEPVIIVEKSTVPVGTGDRLKAHIEAQLAQSGRQLAFTIVSNPEFLKEGSALNDCRRPDRIILGGEDEAALDLMREIYAPFNRNHDRILCMNLRSAELTKYAANAMLATRISFMNELANLAELVGADIEDVRRGIGSDPRIGYGFLYAGTGYGGSCFPKDVKALIKTAAAYGLWLDLAAAVERVNEHQKQVLVEKIVKRFGEDLAGRRFALWGLAFKPDTNDMREAPSCVLVQSLLARGAALSAYDPAAIDEAQRIFGPHPRIRYDDHPMAALDGADALAIVTEWKEFRSPDFGAVRCKLRTPAIFDGRNLYDPAQVVAAGLEYYPIGRKVLQAH